MWFPPASMLIDPADVPDWRVKSKSRVPPTEFAPVTTPPVACAGLPPPAAYEALAAVVKLSTTNPARATCATPTTKIADISPIQRDEFTTTLTSALNCVLGGTDP